jgi:hypothetical protein
VEYSGSKFLKTFQPWKITQLVRTISRSQCGQILVSYFLPSFHIRKTNIILPEQSSVFFRIPPTVPNGEYLIRIEHLALHATSNTGPQFYISCAQIRVDGGGNGTPGPLVSFPGAYDVNDPILSVLFETNMSVSYASFDGEIHAHTRVTETGLTNIRRGPSSLTCIEILDQRSGLDRMRHLRSLDIGPPLLS